MMERFDQELHTRFHMEIPSQKLLKIRRHIAQILIREDSAGSKFLDVAGEPGAAKLDQSLMILIHDQAVFRSVDPELMKGGAHLRRKSKISGDLLLLGDDDPQLINNLGFSEVAEKGACEPMCDDRWRLRGQELRDSRDAVTDYILQQFSGQPADPVPLVCEDGCRISRLRDLVAVVALH